VRTFSRADSRAERGELDQREQSSSAFVSESSFFIQFSGKEFLVRHSSQWKRRHS
jgi:hypothetical protein